METLPPLDFDLPPLDDFGLPPLDDLLDPLPLSEPRSERGQLRLPGIDEVYRDAAPRNDFGLPPLDFGEPSTPAITLTPAPEPARSEQVSVAACTVDAIYLVDREDGRLPHPMRFAGTSRAPGRDRLFYFFVDGEDRVRLTADDFVRRDGSGS